MLRLNFILSFQVTFLCPHFLSFSSSLSFISSPGKSDLRLAGQQLSPRTDSRSTFQVHVASRQKI